MLLYRTQQGALNYDPPSYVDFGRQRVTVEEFRAGKLDDALLERFGLAPLVESLGRLEVASRNLQVSSTAGDHADRSPVQRTWSFGRGNPCAVWIRGRRVSAMAGDISYEAPFEIHLATGFPAALAERLGEDIVARVNGAVGSLAPLPCMCHTGAFELSHHGSLDILASKSDPRAPVEVQATVARCTVCGQGWLFESSGDSHYSFTYSAREFEPKAGLSDEEIEAIMADMRAGYPVTVSKSRGQTTYLALTDGNFRIDDWEDGQGEERPISAAAMRSYIVYSPDTYIDVLRKPLRPVLRDALYAATTPETRLAARDRLDQLLIYGPGPVHHADLTYAFLAWPEEAPNPDLFKDLDGTSVYHAIMSTIGYDQTNEAGGQYGLRFFEAMVAMTGNQAMRGLELARADFYERVGNFEAAKKDLEVEASNYDPPYTANSAESAKRQLERLRRKELNVKLGIPVEDSEIEGQMRRQNCGPPNQGDTLVWNFLESYPADVLRERVWPIASQLLECDDVNVRGRTLEFLGWWSDGQALWIPRLLEVAETKPELYDDQVDQFVTIRSELSSALTFWTDNDDYDKRRAAIQKRLCEKEVLYSADHQMGKHYPDFVIQRLAVWADHGLWFHNASDWLARYHPETVMPFLEAARVLPKEDREAVLKRVTESCKLDPVEMKRAIDL